MRRDGQKKRQDGLTVGGDLEEQQLLLLSHEELAGALDHGEFKVLPWAAIVALGLRIVCSQERRSAIVPPA